MFFVFRSGDGEVYSLWILKVDCLTKAFSWRRIPFFSIPSVMAAGSSSWQCPTQPGSQIHPDWLTATDAPTVRQTGRVDRFINKFDVCAFHIYIYMQGGKQHAASSPTILWCPFVLYLCYCVFLDYLARCFFSSQDRVFCNRRWLWTGYRLVCKEKLKWWQLESSKKILSLDYWKPTA